MSHSPLQNPLPYCGAINLKSILENQNPEFMNDPQQVLQKQKDKLELTDKKKEEDDNQINSLFRTSAFMGPSLWDDRSLIPYTDINDFKVELLDNEDFWSELNALSDGQGLAELAQNEPQTPPETPMNHDAADSRNSPPISPSIPSSPLSDAGPSITSQILTSPVLSDALMRNPGSPNSGSTSTEKPEQQFFEKYTPDALVLASVPGEGLFNPGKRKFQTEELKPQPVLKKSKKIFVADDCKDEKYWNRRQKNNTAAKRSRDAKRIKENQIALRAGFLEEENDYLRKQVQKYKAENNNLKSRLEFYEQSQSP